ncbi:1-acyl-sn-glycerol-3-phosphate acyltransferase [bacterium]|nr:1-acyl-sn-glycerol-3-phosphate acyltransferase [bacterium]
MRENNCVYHFSRIFFKTVLCVLFRGRIKGSVPRGGAVICINHTTNLDPPLTGTITSKPIHFMAKEELFENPLFRMLICALNSFPVNRNFFDRKAFRRAIELAESGKNIGIFPEGTRNKSGTDKIGPIKRGMSYLIYHTSVPVIPVFISGGSRWKKLGRITINIGEAIDLPERKIPYTKETAESICRKIKNGLEKTSKG